MNSRERRLAENELLFGAVNEEILSMRDRLPSGDDDLRILCECAHEDCSERLAVAVEEYRRVSEQPAWFALLPEHVVPDLEDVIEEHDGWVVVEKREPVKSALEQGSIST